MTDREAEQGIARAAEQGFRGAVVLKKDRHYAVVNVPGGIITVYGDGRVDYSEGLDRRSKWDPAEAASEQAALSRLGVSPNQPHKFECGTPAFRCKVCGFTADAARHARYGRSWYDVI